MFAKSLRLVLALTCGALSSTAVAAPKDEITLGTSFAEDGGPSDGWTFGWHGYARLPVRFVDAPLGERGPDLVDDNYRQSGFAYLRVNETEWVELALSAERKRTRVVAGLFAANLSDWSDRQGNSSTPATAFIEHTMTPHKQLELKTRVGMFWRRLGYIAPYDTYLIGRTHTAGAMLRAKAYKHFVLEGGAGGHARNSQEVFGFGPTAWLVAGVEYPSVQLRGYYLKTWNDDEDRSRSYTRTGSLSVTGFDTHLAIPSFGRIGYTFSFIDAKNTEFIGRAVEVLHSTDGKTLKLNFLGSEENGTGEIQAQALDVSWELHRSLRPLIGRAAQSVRGAVLDIYGMTAHVATPHEVGAIGDPGKNDRRYLKWGTDLRYQPLGFGLTNPIVAFRFDRVIMHTDHDSLSFRVYSPRIGVQLTAGVDVYAQWSHYDYGDNVTGDLFDELAERATRSANADLSAVRPDVDVFKIQAQARW